MVQAETFFDFAAYVGLTKHLGERDATDRLAELCHLGEGNMRGQVLKCELSYMTASEIKVAKPPLRF